MADQPEISVLRDRVRRAGDETRQLRVGAVQLAAMLFVSTLLLVGLYSAVILWARAVDLAALIWIAAPAAGVCALLSAVGMAVTAPLGFLYPRVYRFWLR